MTSLVIGCCEPSSQRARALLDGSIPVAGCSTRFVKLGPGDMLLRAFANPELNVAELSLSNLVTRVAKRDCPYILLPVFIARSFPHQWFYARTDRNISQIGDLRGRRVGVGAYQRTLYVWARGFLTDEYSIQLNDIHWVVKDKPDVIDAFAPTGVPVEIISSAATLSDLLETGEIDAMISLHPPECFKRGVSQVKRIVQNDEEAAANYFRATQVFPILHVMGIRRELARDNPKLSRDLLDAFSKAKVIAFQAVKEGTSWQNDAFTYGIDEPNRKALEFFVRHHFAQGLSNRQLSVDELFAPLPMAYYGEGA